MGNKKKDPHKTEIFWIGRMKEVLENKYISPEYRERCEAILQESQDSFAEHNKQNSLHYRRDRQ